MKAEKKAVSQDTQANLNMAFLLERASTVAKELIERDITLRTIHTHNYDPEPYILIAYDANAEAFRKDMTLLGRSRPCANGFIEEFMYKDTIVRWQHPPRIDASQLH